MGCRCCAVVVLLALGGALLVSGCGDDDGDGTCVSGTTMPCILPDGRSGVRQCGSDFRWAAECVVTPDGGLGSVAAPPEIPWLDDGTPAIAGPAFVCPAGWREVPPDTDGAPATCDPYPEGGALSCAEGQAHFPGEPGCADVGSPCPAGEFSDSLPSDRRVVYVRPGATGGDGSASSPYGSVTEFSIGGLPRASVIALSRGTHQGPMRLARGIALQGACAADTRVTTSTPSSTEGLVAFRDTGCEVRDLTMTDSPREGIHMAGPGTDATLDGVVISGLSEAGVFLLSEGRLAGRSVVVRDTRPGSDGYGYGLRANLSAEIDLDRAVLERNAGIGAAGAVGGVVTLTDAVVRETRSLFDGTRGNGLNLESGAGATVTRALLEDNLTSGIHAQDADSSLTLVDVVIRRTGSRPRDMRGGRGLEVLVGVVLDATRVRLSDDRGIGVLAFGAGTSATLADLVVRDIHSEAADSIEGYGVGAFDGATADVTRAFVERTRSAGVAVGAPGAPGTTVTLEDAVVRDTESQESDGVGGYGLVTWAGAASTSTRVLFEGNRALGVFVSEPGSTATLTDVAVRDTRTEEAGTATGRGSEINGGATASLTRVVFDRNREVGLMVATAGTSVTGTDVVVRDMRPRDDDDYMGLGLMVVLGARTELMRAVFERTLTLGIGVGDGSSRTTLSDVVVRNTRVAECSTTTCTDRPTGHGVGVYEQGELVLDRFLIEDADTCGVHVAGEASVDLMDGDVRGHEIGACVQVADYDLARLENGVRFGDNDVNLQATTLPVPELAVPTVLPP